MTWLSNEFVTLVADVVLVICLCSWFDGCFTGLFGPSLTPLAHTTGRMCRHGKTLVVRGNLIAERPAKEQWHGSTRAVQMFASVSEGFLHRNRVLSVPSKPPLSVVLSKSGSRRWIHFYAGCEIEAHDLSVALCSLHGFHGDHGVLQSCDWLDHAHFLSWTSSFELTSWLMKKNGFHFRFEAPFVWTHRRLSIFLADNFSVPGCHSVSWLAAVLHNHLTGAAKGPHPNLSLKVH